MSIDTFILIAGVLGTILSVTYAIRANSVGSMIFWFFMGGFELVTTILKAMQIFV